MITNDSVSAAGAGRPLATLWSMHYLRAVAAFAVVSFHCLGDAGFRFELGAAGIHLFFTLSGFMMWSIAGNPTARPGPFLLGRVRRIVPMYWIGTAIAVASTWIVPGFFYQATRQVPMIVKSLFFIPQIGVQGGVYPVLYLGWTLQYEMYFYLLFALCLFAPARLRFELLTALFVALAAIGTLFPMRSPALQTYTNPICLEFLAGAMVARFGWRIASPRLALVVTVASAVAFCLADRFETAFWIFSPLVIGGTASGVIVGLLSIEARGRLPHNRFLLLLGEASFAIYLFQDVGFASVHSIVRGADPIVRAAVSAIAAGMAGVAVHLAIERPLTAWMKRLGKGPRISILPIMSRTAIVEP